MEIDKIYAVPRWDGKTPLLFFPMSKCRNGFIHWYSLHDSGLHDMDFFLSCAITPPTERAREDMGKLITGVISRIYNNQKLLITYKDRAKYRKERWGHE